MPAKSPIRLDKFSRAECHTVPGAPPRGSIGEKSAPALASEGALGDELGDAIGHGLAERLSKRGGDVQADQIEQREGTHRMARPESHARVDAGRLHARLFEQ